MKITLSRTLAGQPAGTELHVPDTIGDRLIARGIAHNGRTTEPDTDAPEPKSTRRRSKTTTKGGGHSPSP